MLDSTFEPSAFGLPETPQVTVALGDAAATRQLGATLAKTLTRGGFVGLIGQLGAGKTTLVQGAVEALDPSERATSPTYTLLHEYETTPPVVHIDLYRLETYDELESIGYWDYVESGAAVSFVEWVDQVPEAWPGGSESIVVELRREGAARLARVFWVPDVEHTDLADALRALSS